MRIAGAILGTPVDVVEERPAATPEELEEQRLDDYLQEVFDYADEHFEDHDSEGRYCFLKAAWREWEECRDLVAERRWAELRQRLGGLADERR